MIDSMEGLKRTHTCGQLNGDDIDREVTLMGWVQRRRDHGGMIFVNLRDRYGTTQVVFSPELNKDAHDKASFIRSQYVVAVKGRVSKRPEGTQNSQLSTGKIEVLVNELRVLNIAINPPFPIEEDVDVGEDIRLKYRYLDLRRENLQRNLILRSKVAQAVREYLYKEEFLEVETPFLTKSTPEGARDYLVPSRVNPGSFYALPQSPQLFKQLLMIGGYDRYFQIVRCFRDEDLRADRQPEFTQVDMELSFVDREDICRIVEGMMAFLFKEVLGVDILVPFKTLTYNDALERYGLDNPDMRFGLELVDVSDIFQTSGFGVFVDVLGKGGVIKALNAKGCSGFSRKDLDSLEALAKVYGAKGLSWLKYGSGTWHSPIAKFLNDSEKGKLSERVGTSEDDLVLLVADCPKIAREALGHIRLSIADKLGLVQGGAFDFTWIIDFPLLEYDENTMSYAAMHHPFTAPVDGNVSKLKSVPGNARAKAYDLVLNGSEIGGGSIRIHDTELQSTMFEILNIGEDEAQDKFGFLLNALRYGAPPHGGIAIGLDRLVMILAGTESIRDVIAFPKTQRATCLMTEAPSKVERKQLSELSLRLDRTD